MKKEEGYQPVQQAINVIKEKMKLINYGNLHPPYFLHTVTKYRQTFLSKFVKEINIEDKDCAKVREQLKVVKYIIENFDDECLDAYAAQLIEPYIRKMFQDNYEFEAIDFKEVNVQYHMKTEIEETLTAAAQWLTQVEITQDLLSRIEVYFKLKTPHVLEKIRENGLKSEKNTWAGSIASSIKRLASFTLRKGSKTIQSTFFTALAPGAIMLTWAIIGGSASLPWKTDIDFNRLIPLAAVAAIPYILDTMAENVEKSDYSVALRRWAINFSEMAESITKFNQCLESSIRNCTISSTVAQFEIERTNLQKIVNELSKNINTVSEFDEQRLEQMRERTEAYFREYIEVKEGEWTVVILKEEN